MLSITDVDNGLDIASFDNDIEQGNIDGVIIRFQSLFAKPPHPTGKTSESVGKNFQNVIYIVFTLLEKWSEVKNEPIAS